MTDAIHIENVMKSFILEHEKKDKIIDHLISIVKRGKNNEVFMALDNISFTVKKGEMFGIVGRNGSGKTTLLKLLSRIIQPDSGSIKVDGVVIPFLSLGSGFLQEMSVMDNIIIYGVILGFTEKQMQVKSDSIIKFAELEQFKDIKLKNLSSGMHSRLAFATAMQVNPDILLVDEVLAVGDQWFQQKSFNSFMEFKRNNKTIVFVSHDLSTVETICDRVMLMERGKVVAIGNPKEIIELYRKQPFN